MNGITAPVTHGNNLDFIDKSFAKEAILSRSQSKDVEIRNLQLECNVVAAGNNYCSEVCRLKVSYVENGTAKDVTFFLKIPFVAPLYTLVKKYGFYEKEVYMYEEILPEMHRLIPGEYLVPMNYFCSVPEMLVLQDLKQSGYRMANRNEQLDLPHALIALKTLAKFHALSVKVNQLHPEKIAKVKRDKFFQPDEGEDFNSPDRQMFAKGLNKLVELAKERNFPCAQALQQFDIWSVMKEGMIPAKENFSVLCHGDFWLNNILFKYDEKTGLPSKSKMIDLQICRWCSPVVDLIYLIITSIQFEVFEQHGQMLLKTYRDTLTNILKLTDCDNVSYPESDFQADMRKAYKYGIIVMASVLPIVVADPDNPVNLRELEGKKGEVSENLYDSMGKVYQMEKYAVVVRKWLKFYEKNKFLQ